MPAPSLEDWLRSRVKDVAGEAALAAGKRLAEGAPVSFLARYRKDATLGLDEAALRRVQTAREVFERLEARRATILEAAERQKKRGPELEERLAAASDLVTLEDLFLPFRRKKGPTAAAREAGLEPLAEWIWRTGHGTETPQEGQTLELWSFTFRNPEKGVKEAADAVAGARGLLAERLAEDPDLRALARREVFAHGVLEAHRTDKAKAGSKHEALFSLREKASALRNGDGFHRVFALRRSANEGELQLKVVPPPDDPSVRERLLQAFETAACSVPDSPGAAVLKQAAREALEEHVWPDLEAELIQSIREEADRAAIRLLAEGARRRLMAPPLGARPVLGLHPTKDGGVLALVDASGRLVKAARFLLGEEKASEARELVASLVREGGAAAVAVGEATAGRERVAFVEDALRAAGLQAVVQGVSEAAAAAWRASEDARAELKEADTETRSAVALARRLQDPLLELAKLEPRSLAEGPYVHEVSARLLAKRLEQTLDSCLHEVGLDLNRASWKPLSRVAGLDEERARAIVAHREKRGPFASRAALLQEGLLDEKAFEQAAGFLLVPASAHPLDATRVHPERYPALEAWAIRHGKALADLRGEGAAPLLEDAGLRDALGPRTLEDVVAELRAPGRDPRGPFVPFRYRAGVSRLEDLRPGMICPGLVTNATSFGVFVDVGVPHDGLVHLSQLPAPEGGAPRPALLPGDRVEVRVVKVDLEKKQISLSMRGLGERAAPPRAGEQRAGRGERRPRPPRARPGTSEAPAHASKPAPDARQAPPPRVARPRPSPPPPRPDGAERSGPRPERPRPRADRPSSPDRPGAPSRPAFNNPFAVLAKLKEPKKD